MGFASNVATPKIVAKELLVTRAAAKCSPVIVKAMQIVRVVKSAKIIAAKDVRRTRIAAMDVVIKDAARKPSAAIPIAIVRIIKNVSTAFAPLPRRN
jgi:hypothetical protein